MGIHALVEWLPGPTGSLYQQPTLLGPCRLLYPGKRRDGFLLTVALGTPPLSDTTSPALLLSTTPLDQLGTLTSSSQGTQQWRPSLGRRHLCPHWRSTSKLAPSPQDPSFGRPTTWAWSGRYTTLWQAPGFCLRPPSGVKAPS